MLHRLRASIHWEYIKMDERFPLWGGGEKLPLKPLLLYCGHKVARFCPDTASVRLGSAELCSRIWEGTVGFITVFTKSCASLIQSRHSQVTFSRSTYPTCTPRPSNCCVSFRFFHTVYISHVIHTFYKSQPTLPLWYDNSNDMSEITCLKICEGLQ